MNNIWGVILSFVLVFVIIGGSTVLSKLKLLDEEQSRKFIHIGVSNWWFLMMFFFDNLWMAIIAPIAFIILNYASYKMNLIKSMERNGKGNLGTVYFPVSLLILVITSFLLDNFLIGAMGIFILGYGDGLAAVIGKKFGKIKLMNQKSMIGTFTMFIVSLVVGVLLQIGFTSTPLIHIVWISIVLAVLATLVELFTPKGLDNLSVPLMTSLVYYLLLFAI